MADYVDIQIGDVRATLAKLVYGGATMPADVAEKLGGWINESPVVAAVNASKLIYARRTELSPEVMHVGAGFAMLTHVNGFHGMQGDDLGLRMYRALRRDAGDPKPTGGWQKVADDPEPAPEFVVEPAADPVADPVAAPA